MLDLSLMEIALYLLIGVFSFILGYAIRGLVELRAEKLDEYLEENEEEILEHIFEMLDAKIDEALEVEKEVVLRRKVWKGIKRMIKFNSIEEIKKYYNKNTNTYEFIEDDFLLDVEFAFDLGINGNIKALNINALNINAWDIDAGDINAQNINAWDINAGDINAGDINALNINAGDITYYAVCFAYQNIECSSIKGRRVNAKHFVLDGEIKIIEKDKRLENES